MTQSHKYQVAISFAGEDRQAADSLAHSLKARGVSVFYDDFERADLWGKDLYQHFQSVYRDMAQFCVVLLSAAYVRKAWTRHELKQAQARAFSESREYILPLRLDDAPVPGINDTTGYIDLRKTNVDAVTDLILKKLGLQP